MTIYPENRTQLRAWLMANATTEKEVWVLCSRSKTPTHLPYLDVVEEALCFGWIDSTVRKNPHGEGCLQRLSPRRKRSHWTELNIQRCKQLIAQGLMTPAGLDAMPNRRNDD